MPARRNEMQAGHVVGFHNLIMFIVPHNFSTNNLIRCVNLFRIVHFESVRCRRLVPIRYAARAVRKSRFLFS